VKNSEKHLSCTLAHSALFSCPTFQQVGNQCNLQQPQDAGSRTRKDGPITGALEGRIRIRKKITERKREEERGKREK